ncbi:MAG: ribosomal protein S18-alanine N-acetyltransferase [Oscillospiraceae bacterium]|nr:ribosomal protein S18-alanine N-acetyltransferase [Oscillospiraceae bacterium]
MKIFSIDTSGMAASVAIAADGRLAGGLWLEHGKTHSQTLMSCVEALLATTEVELPDIDVFVAVNGPGSFTGLRIGVTTIKALAYANCAKVAAVSTFECLAFNLLAYTDRLLCSMIDARNNQVYYQMFRTDGASLEKVCDGDVVNVGVMVQKLREAAAGSGVVINGDAAKGYLDFIKGELGESDVVCAPERSLYTDASAAALLVGKEVEGGVLTRLEAPFSLTPNYMRVSQAERVRAEKLQAEELKTEAPQAEKLKTEELQADKLKTEKLQAEKLKTETPQAEKLKTETPQAEKLKTEKLQEERREEEKHKNYVHQAEKLETGGLQVERFQAERTRAVYLKAKSSHIDQILKIERLCFSDPWSHAMFADEFENRRAHYFIALVDEEIVGYCGFWSILDEGHITNIAVHPNFRRRGIGAGLVNKLLSYASHNGIESFTLEVREDNTQAIRLYKKFGFVSVGIRKNYYRKEKKNAVIMWKK